MTVYQPDPSWNQTQIGRVICLGKNYAEHAAEFAAFAAESTVVPTDPVVFTKATSALCGATDFIDVEDRFAQALDYEVELGVVIGTAGRDVMPSAASDHIAGFTVFNDITARDLQTRHQQWFLGKSLIHSTPVGPRVVAAALDTLSHRSIKSWVNGELRQKAKLGQMIFAVEDAIALISTITPLQVGDLIAMGTPSGVGVGFSPPRYLHDGDRIVCEIEGIGRLDNTIRITNQSVPVDKKVQPLSAMSHMKESI